MAIKVEIAREPREKREERRERRRARRVREREDRPSRSAPGSEDARGLVEAFALAQPEEACVHPPPRPASPPSLHERPRLTL